jgi:hypothetical protein
MFSVGSPWKIAPGRPGYFCSLNFLTKDGRNWVPGPEKDWAFICNVHYSNCQGSTRDNTDVLPTIFVHRQFVKYLVIRYKPAHTGDDDIPAVQVVLLFCIHFSRISWIKSNGRKGSLTWFGFIGTEDFCRQKFKIVDLLAEKGALLFIRAFHASYPCRACAVEIVVKTASRGHLKISKRRVHLLIVLL